MGTVLAVVLLVLILGLNCLPSGGPERPGRPLALKSTNCRPLEACRASFYSVLIDLMTDLAKQFESLPTGLVLTAKSTGQRPAARLIGNGWRAWELPMAARSTPLPWRWFNPSTKWQRRTDRQAGSAMSAIWPVMDWLP